MLSLLCHSVNYVSFEAHTYCYLEMCHIIEDKDAHFTVTVSKGSENFVHCCFFRLVTSFLSLVFLRIL